MIRAISEQFATEQPERIEHVGDGLFIARRQDRDVLWSVNVTDARMDVLFDGARPVGKLAENMRRCRGKEGGRGLPCRHGALWACRSKDLERVDLFLGQHVSIKRRSEPDFEVLGQIFVSIVVRGHGPGAGRKLMKICIPGNCQAQHMEMMLHMANPDLEIAKLAPVFLMKDSNKDAVYAKFSESDVILTQRISNEYNLDWIASSELRREFGDKVSVWPNIYFDGYFPGVQYIYLAKWGKLPSPLGEYHFGQIYAAHATGKTTDQAVEDFAGERLFETSPNPIDGSLEQLRAREADVDVPISDVIADSVAEKRQFYTPNHPVNGLLGVMLERLTARAGIKFDAEKAVEAPYKLDECYIAASPAIVNRFKLPFDHQTVYRGREIVAVEPHMVTLGDVCDYDSHSLVEAFYRIYDAVRNHA